MQLLRPKASNGCCGTSFGLFMILTIQMTNTTYLVPPLICSIIRSLLTLSSAFIKQTGSGRRAPSLLRKSCCFGTCRRGRKYFTVRGLQAAQRCVQFHSRSLRSVRNWHLHRQVLVSLRSGALHWSPTPPFFLYFFFLSLGWVRTCDRCRVSCTVAGYSPMEARNVNCMWHPCRQLDWKKQSSWSYKILQIACNLVHNGLRTYGLGLHGNPDICNCAADATGLLLEAFSINLLWSKKTVSKLFPCFWMNRTSLMHAKCLQHIR